MKVGTAAKVFLGKNELVKEFSGIQIGTDVILGKAEGRTKDLSGLVLSNYLMLGKGISRAVIATVYGVPPLSLPNAIASSLYSLKAFGGTEHIPETYIDTVTADGKCEQRNLPAGYTQRNFVYMMDGSYLLTDLVPTYDCKIEMDFATTTVVNGSAILGGRTASFGGMFFGVPSAGVYAIDAFGTSSADRYVSAVTPATNTRYKFTFDNNVATLESGGSTLFTNTFTSTQANGAALVINAVNTNGTISANNEGIYLYSFKMWNGQGELIADYVPCAQLHPLTVGFYDMVSKSFKGPTSGTFAAGTEAVPTPDAPIDIICNNGVLKARHESGLPLGYTLLDYIESTGTQYIDTGVSDNATIKITAQASTIKGSSQALLSSTPAAQGGTWFGEFTTNQKWGIGSGGGLSTLDPTTKMTAEITFNASGCSGTVNGESVTRSATVTQGNWTIMATSQLNYPFSGKVWGCQITQSGVLVRNFIPAKNSSNVVGMYDTVNDVFYQNAGTGTFTAGSAVSDPVEVYTDGTIETITDALSNTATCERLLSVGDYKDTQEILSGAVTRNVGIKVMTGSETFQTGTNGWISEDTITNNLSAIYTPICTHFAGTDATPVANSNTVRVYYTSQNVPRVYFGVDKTITEFSSTTAFQQWLADQYNAGTPVIIVYPLATATTETVTGQLLDQEPVTAVGSLSNLVATAVSSSHSTPTPIHPLDINCNNGVLKYGNVSKNLFDEDYGELGSSFVYKSLYLGPGTYTCSYSLPAQSGNTSILYFLNGNVSAGASNGVNQVDASTPRTVNSSTGYVTLAYRKGDAINLPGKVPSDYNCMVASGGTETPYEPYRLAVYADGLQETINVHTKNLFDEQWNRNTGVSTQTATWGRVVTAQGWSTSGLIPVKAGQQYTVSYNTTVQKYVFYYESDGTMQQSYDYSTSNTKKTFTVPAGATHIRLQVDKSSEAAIADLETQLESGATATTHTSYFNGGTAVAEMLLSVGTYTDEQEVISGGVTRNVGVKVFDGTESWSVASTNVLQADVFPVSSIQPAVGGYCTALSYTDSSTLSGMPENSFRLGSLVYPRRLYVKSSVYATDATTWTNYLTTQYNAGTPVIVVYPLATETTETVTGQPMSTTEGDNIADITQASMDGLELEVKYYKKP